MHHAVPPFPYFLLAHRTCLVLGYVSCWVLGQLELNQVLNGAREAQPAFGGPYPLPPENLAMRGPWLAASLHLLPGRGAGIKCLTVLRERFQVPVISTVTLIPRKYMLL